MERQRPQLLDDSDRNYWMTAEEAREYGMIDKVLVRQKDAEAEKTTESKGE